MARYRSRKAAMPAMDIKLEINDGELRVTSSSSPCSGKRSRRRRTELRDKICFNKLLDCSIDELKIRHEEIKFWGHRDAFQKVLTRGIVQVRLSFRYGERYGTGL